MTREEVTIQALRNHIEVLEENIRALEKEVKMRDATLDERKSVDEYIKSISTTVVDSWNLEPCEDAISKKDAILQIQKHQICSCDPEECYPEQCERNVISWLSNLPSVTPSRKKGKWIANHDESDDSHTIDCSCCNYTLARVVNTGYTVEQALDCVKDMTKNYCPNCGAEMEVKE